MVKIVKKSLNNPVETEPQGKKKRKEKDKKPNKKPKTLVISAPTNKKEKLVDYELMKPHNFLSSTNSTHTYIYPMDNVGGTKYEVQSEPTRVSTILKLILTIEQTKEMSDLWSLGLWDITQKSDMLEPGVSVTFVRAFEKKDNEDMEKLIRRRSVLGKISNDSEANTKRKSVFKNHDINLLNAIGLGDCVVSFGAEAIITADTEQQLEQAVTTICNYIKANDELSGLEYKLDINKQNYPFVLFGPNNTMKNKDVFVDMTSYDAGLASLVVDAGGDRSLGSEYVGVSVGKLIRSRAAYNFQNAKALYVGNDTLNKTYTIGGEKNIPSQIYLSNVASRSYLLAGQKVTHIVADHAENVKHLMDFPLHDHRKVLADVSKGLLNMIEPIKNDMDMTNSNDRVLGRFTAHINNIIVLLNQFRDIKELSTTDDFATITRDILIDFFVTNKYWSYDAKDNLSDVRLFVRHIDYKTLAELGQYITQRVKIAKSDELKHVKELDNIVNRNILPTIPALNTKTNDIIDELVHVPYKVIDLTGMSVGSMGGINNASMNVMMISYLNVILSSLDNKDVIMIHGISKMSKIAKSIDLMIELSGKNIDIVYTESNQTSAEPLAKNMEFDFVMVDLYSNRVSKLIEPLEIDTEWAKSLKQNKASFYVKTNASSDYIYLDSLL